MNSSDESSRGSSSKSSGRSKSSNKSRNGSDKSSGASASSKGNGKLPAASETVTSEQIEQFCAVTGSSEDVARNLIEACRGNLEMAVNMHMEGLSENPGPSLQDGDDYVRAPIPQKQEVLVQEGYESYGFGFKGKRKVTKSVFDSFRNFEVETKLQESRFNEGLAGHFSSLPGTSASGSSAAAIAKRSLEDLFRPPIDLIFKGNLQAARDAGKVTKKWVMVNIQNVTEFACQVLNRDVWSNKAIKELIRDHFLFLQLYQDSEEGQRYMTFYKIKQWPYVAVLDPRTGELLVEWNYSDKATYEGLISEFVATSSWGDDTAAAAPASPKAKKRRMETILDASEDDQLMAAIQASLAESKAKTTTKLDSSDSENEGDDEDDDGDNVESWTDSESDSRASLPQKVPPVPDETAPTTPSTTSSASTVAPPPGIEVKTIDDDWQQHLGPESDPVSSIVFRFPDGSKEQKSLPCTSTLTAVIKYVNSKGFPGDKYELMANFPKRMLLAMEPSMTLKEAGLFPHETVFVQAR